MPNGSQTLGIYSDNDIETYRNLIFYLVGRFSSIVIGTDDRGRGSLLYPAEEILHPPCNQLENPKLLAFDESSMNKDDSGE